MGRAPGERWSSQRAEIDDVVQAIDCGSPHGYAAAVVNGDRIGLAPVYLQSEVAHQASRVREWDAGGFADGGKKLGDAGILGGELHLVGQKCWQSGIGGGDAEITGRPIDGADGASDIHVVAKSGGLVLPGLSLRKAVVQLLTGLGGQPGNLDAIDVLMDVDSCGRAAHSTGCRGYYRNSGSASRALGDGRVPGAGTSVPITGDGKWCRGVRDSALDNELNVETENRTAKAILGSGAEYLIGPDVERDLVGGVQRDALYASVVGVAAAFAEATSENNDKCDG